MSGRIDGRNIDPTRRLASDRASSIFKKNALLPKFSRMVRRILRLLVRGRNWHLSCTADAVFLVTTPVLTRKVKPCARDHVLRRRRQRLCQLYSLSPPRQPRKTSRQRRLLSRKSTN